MTPIPVKSLYISWAVTPSPSKVSRLPGEKRRSEALIPLYEIEEGWNGNGSAAPNAWALYWTNEVLLKASDRGLQYTAIMPCADDGVTLIFSRSGKKAIIECFNCGEIAVAISSGLNQTEAWGVPAETQNLESTLEWISDFLAG
jgi:hypothetical protein